MGVAERRWSGSWLSGVMSAGDKSQYPGERLGLPESGRVGGRGRPPAGRPDDRLADVQAIALAVFHNQFLTIVVFAVEIYAADRADRLHGGQAAAGPAGGADWTARPVGLIWSLVRTLLFLAVVPPLVFDSDLRGLHDKAANTVVIRIWPRRAAVSGSLGRGAFGIRPAFGIGPLGICSDCGSAFSR